jgi:hypothetical protein
LKESKTSHNIITLTINSRLLSLSSTYFVCDYICFDFFVELCRLIELKIENQAISSIHVEMCNAMHEYSNTYLRAFYRTLVSRLKTAMKDKANTSSFQELSNACLKDEMTMTELVTLITA